MVEFYTEMDVFVPGTRDPGAAPLARAQADEAQELAVPRTERVGRGVQLQSRRRLTALRPACRRSIARAARWPRIATLSFERASMRLVRFSAGDAPAVPGLLVDGHVRALTDLVPDAPQDTRDVIADWDRVKKAIDGAGTGAGGLPLDQVTLRAPIPARARSSRSGSTTPTISRRRRTPG